MTEIDITIINEYTRSDERIISEVLFDNMREEIAHMHDLIFSRASVLRIIDKYKAESEGKHDSI